MELKEKSEKLKELVSTYDSKWLLGDLSFVIHSGRERAFDQLGQLSSPMRQLHYLAGLNISTNKENGIDFIYNQEKWNEIVTLLNDIESQYQNLLLEKNETVDFEEWKKVLDIAVPSFLTYFNVGHLNFEEQILNWVTDLYSNFDDLLNEQYGLVTYDFISFYENLDKLIQNNFQAHSTNPDLLRENWEEYTSIESGIDEKLPAFFRESIPKDFLVRSKFMIDKGMKDRFYPKELVSENLSIEKVKKILNIFSIKRKERNFLYYTETNPGNPLYDFPIVDIENGQYQVFEIKQVIHSINNLLEQIIVKENKRKEKYLKLKGDLLENNIVSH